jgi:thiosulfate/3-mercaptopyruvate sulfurtransferase
MTRYVIIGAGAVGGSIGAQLQLAGASVVAVARGAHLDAVREHGLRYLRPEGPRQVPLDVVAAPEDLTLRHDDVLLLAAKSQDTEAIVAQWAWQPVQQADGGVRSAGESLPIVVLQNGIDNERAALRRFDRVYGAVVWSPSAHVVPGEVVAPGESLVAALWIGRYPSGPADELADDARLFNASGIAVQLVDDIQRWKAAKLIGNLDNALDALYAPSPLRSQTLAAVQAEARGVLAAAGVEVGDLLRDSTLDLSGLAVRPVPGGERGGGSTWQSLARAGSLETDYLNGEIVLQARLAGVPAPLNAALQARIQRGAREGVAAGSLGDDDLRADIPLEAGLVSV